MSIPDKSIFSTALKEHLAQITAVIAFVSLLASVASAFLPKWRIMVGAFLLAATIIAIIFNTWVALEKEQSKLDSQKKILRYSKRFRVGLHFSTAIIVIIVWVIFLLASSHQHMGHLFFRLGQYDRAIEQFSADLPTTINDYSAGLQLAESYRAVERPKDAFVTFEALLGNARRRRRNQENSSLEQEYTLHYKAAFTLLGEDYIEGVSDRLSKARAHLERAQLLLGEQPEILALSTFAMAAQIRESGQGRESAFAKVSETANLARNGLPESRVSTKQQREQDTFCHYWFGRAFKIIGYGNDAKSELEAGLALVISSTDIPMRDRFLYQLGDNELAISHDKTGTVDLEKANAYWKQMNSPYYLVRTLEKTGGALLLAGWKAEQTGRLERAKENFRDARVLLSEAKRRGERSFKVDRWLGIIALHEGNYDLALNLFDSALQIEPNDHDGHYYRARTLFEKNQFDDARKAAEQASKLKPENALVHSLLGRILGKSKNYDKAALEFQQAIQLGDIGSYKYLIHTFLDRALGKNPYSSDQIMEYENALQVAEEAIENTKKDEGEAKEVSALQRQTWNDLAFTYAVSGLNLELALQYIDHALKEEPNDPHFLDTKAWVLIRSAEHNTRSQAGEKRSHLNEAENLLKKARDRYKEDDPTSLADTLFHLGYVHKLRCEYAEAKKYFLEALRIRPVHHEAKEALSELADQCNSRTGLRTNLRDSGRN